MTAAIAFRCNAIRNTLRLGAAPLAGERRAPTHGRPRRLPFSPWGNRAWGTVTLQNDEGVPLAAALDHFATLEEQAAVAAWRGKTVATREHFVAWRNNHEDRSPATRATPRLYEPDGGMCEYAPYVRPVFLAALAAMEACAARLTDALRAGQWVLSYLPKAAGADRKNAPISQWRDFKIVASRSLEPSIARVAPVDDPEWQRRDGHQAGSRLFRYIAEGAATKKGKTLNFDEEAGLTKDLVALVAADSRASERPAAYWKGKLKAVDKRMSDTAFSERIWPAAQTELARAGVATKKRGRPSRGASGSGK